MAFITRSEIDSVFGTANVTRWSQLDPDLTTADTARITSAIAWAEAYVQDRLRGSRYAVPFGSVTSTVTDWLAKLAGVWLYESRGALDSEGGEDENRHRFHRKAVEREINGVIAGAVRLDMPLAHGTQPTVPTVPGVW